LEGGYEEPRTEVEKKLAEIWGEVLGVERVGIHDNFFDLGGHSLLATQVVSRIREGFDTILTLHTMFERPTIAELAENISFHIREKDDAESAQLDCILSHVEGLNDTEVEIELMRRLRALQSA
jgi:acyl carrier protein